MKSGYPRPGTLSLGFRVWPQPRRINVAVAHECQGMGSSTIDLGEKSPCYLASLSENGEEIVWGLCYLLLHVYIVFFTSIWLFMYNLSLCKHNSIFYVKVWTLFLVLPHLIFDNVVDDLVASIESLKTLWILRKFFGHVMQYLQIHQQIVHFLIASTNFC